MPGVRVDGNDVLAVYRAVSEAVQNARARRRADVHRVRHLPHGRAFDERRPDALPQRRRGATMGEARSDRPTPKTSSLPRAGRRRSTTAGWNAEIGDEISEAIAEVERHGPPPRDSLFDDVYAEAPLAPVEQRRELLELDAGTGTLSHDRRQTFDAIVSGRRPRRLRVRDPARAARPEAWSAWKKKSRRRVPELGLHPVEGADRQCAPSTTRPSTRRTWASTLRVNRARPGQDAGLEGRASSRS